MNTVEQIKHNGQVVDQQVNMIKYKNKYVRYMIHDNEVYFTIESLLIIFGYDNIVSKEWINKTDKIKAMKHILNNLDTTSETVLEGITFIKNFKV